LQLLLLLLFLLFLCLKLIRLSANSCCHVHSNFLSLEPSLCWVSSGIAFGFALDLQFE
jgi:hypothetical protein